MLCTAYHLCRIGDITLADHVIAAVGGDRVRRLGRAPTGLTDVVAADMRIALARHIADREENVDKLIRLHRAWLIEFGGTTCAPSVVTDLDALTGSAVSHSAHWKEATGLGLMSPADLHDDGEWLTAWLSGRDPVSVAGGLVDLVDCRSRIRLVGSWSTNGSGHPLRECGDLAAEVLCRLLGMPRGEARSSRQWREQLEEIQGIGLTMYLLKALEGGGLQSEVAGQRLVSCEDTRHLILERLHSEDAALQAQIALLVVGQPGVAVGSFAKPLLEASSTLDLWKAVQIWWRLVDSPAKAQVVEMVRSRLAASGDSHAFLHAWLYVVSPATVLDVTKEAVRTLRGSKRLAWGLLQAAPWWREARSSPEWTAWGRAVGSLMREVGSIHKANMRWDLETWQALVTWGGDEWGLRTVLGWDW